MPSFGPSTFNESIDYASLDKSNVEPTEADRQFAQESISGIRMGATGSIAASVGFAGLDLADTVASALPGVERGSVNETFLGAIGSPGLNKFYNDNKGAIEVGSGIAGVIAADYTAGRLLKPASFAMRAIKGIPGVRTIASLDKQLVNAERLAMITAREGAARGLTDVARVSTETMNLARLGDTALTVTPKLAARGVFRAQMAKGLARNATTELVMATTLHNNSFLYSDDFAHNLAWGALGLGIGGAVDSFIGAHTLRKIANSDTIRRLNAAAYDVTGKEVSRLEAMTRAKDLGKVITLDNQAIFFNGVGIHFDGVTSLAIQAAENRKVRGFTERARALFSKREAIATPQLKQAFEEANKGTIRGLQGVSKAGFAMSEKGSKPGAFYMVREGLERQPEYLWGIEEVGTVIDDMPLLDVDGLRSANLSQRVDEVEKLLSDGGRFKTATRKGPDGNPETYKRLQKLKPEETEALQLERRLLEDSQSRVGLVSFEPGEWAPLGFANVVEGFTPRTIMQESAGDFRIFQRTKEKGESALGFGTDGSMYLPKGKSLESLDIKDMLHLYHAGREAIEWFGRGGDGVFRVGDKPNWFQLDIAEQILKVTDDPTKVQLPAGMTRETAKVEAFAQKVDAARKLEKFIAANQLRGLDVSLDGVEAFRLKLHLNLPRLTSHQQALTESGAHPLDILLNSFKSGDEVRKTPYVELLKGMQDAKTIAGFTDEVQPLLDDLSGNSFRFLKGRDGQDLTPLIGYRRQMAPVEWSQDSLELRQAMKALHVQDALMGESADAFTREIVQLATADPNFIEAGKVSQLADDQIRSGIPGFRTSAPESTFGAALNAVTSRERRDVDNLTMLAASRIKETITRITQGKMRQLIESAMGDTITRVNQPGNAASKLLLNQFHTHRQGWELLAKPTQVPGPNGKIFIAFVLDHESIANQRRFAQMMDGAELQKGQLLMTPDGKPVVMDGLAMDTLNRLQVIHNASLQMKNTILRAQGLPQLKSVPFYAPPPSTKGKFIAYTFDESDNIVPGMTVIANTSEELGRLKADLVNSSQWKNGYTLRQREQVESFMDLWDKAQMDYISPNVTAIQPKKHNFGLTSGNALNPNAFDEALVHVRDTLVSHGDDITQTLFREQIKSAGARAAISNLAKRSGITDAVSHSSIYSRYVENLTGRNALSASDSFLGDFYKTMEQRLNGFLAEAQGKLASSPNEGIKAYLGLASPTASKANKERFDQLSQKLGQYMPFKTAMEMVEKQTGRKTPIEVAQITSKLSWFEASSRLRWLESMHAVANFGGILANAPAVIRALQPLAGESIEQTAKRTSNLVMNQASPDGRSIPVLNIPKLMWKGMKDSWNKVPDEFTAKGIRMGYFDQEVAEFNRQWGAIDSHEGWRAFVFGNASAEGTGFGAKLQRTGGLDKWLSVMSDKSEAFSRSWGMYMGREVAQAMGIHNVDDQLSFAHDITNKMIANYDPRNRPEIFQGALGAPLGLFQSYVMNYYQRMFRYLETENHRALGIQFASQGSIFGIESLPGWNAVNWAFFDQGQAAAVEGDPVDSMYQRFGQDEADLLMHGLLSNLPKLFGQDGVSLYTRGDSEVRMPSISAGPIADTMGRVATAFTQAVGAFQANNGSVGIQQMSEILSNMVTNRPIGGMLEIVGASGYDTTGDGQVVSEAKSAMDGIYRVMGVKSMQQQKQTEAFYSNKTAMEEQGARRDAVTQAARAAIRAGNAEKVPELFKNYVKQGGDPKNFSRWVKDVAKSATETRSERQLEKALKNPDKNMSYIMRLMESQVPISEAEQSAEDYGQAQMIDDIVSQSWETTPVPADTEAPPPVESPLDQY